jgi:Protein of unknown function (DUF2865)
VDLGARTEQAVKRSLANLARLSAFSVLSTTLLASTPASAQGLFEFLFGGGPRQQRSIPQRADPYADPDTNPGGVPYGQPDTGRAVAYCVRLCDGRYFPIQRHANATPIQLCNAFCPSAKTQVFNGGAIDYAVAPTGTRYADIENAFVYRDRIVPDCTCNGKDAFGLAKIDVANDPTLRAGDLIATANGVTTYKGGERTTRTASDYAPERGYPSYPSYQPRRRTVPSDAYPDD